MKPCGRARSGVAGKCVFQLGAPAAEPAFGSNSTTLCDFSFASGEVVAVGKDVDSFVVGDALMAANTGPCNRCFYCERGQQNLCESIMDEMVLGGYGEMLRIPARVLTSNAFHKPETLSWEHAALLEPLSSVCFALSHLGDHDLRRETFEQREASDDRYRAAR